MRPTESVRLTVRVRPRASRESVEISAARLEVSVTAPPVDGKATAACLKLLARCLGLPPSAVTLFRGARSPVKVIAVRGLGLDAIRARLGGSDGR